MLTLKRLKAAEITREEFYRFAQIERAGRPLFSSGEQLLNLLKQYEVYACFDGDTMAGYIAVDPSCRYFGRSLLIESMKPHWQYNDDKTLTFLVRGAAACYPNLPDCVNVVVDCRKPKENAALFLAMGFVPSFTPSRLGRDYTVYLKSLGAFRAAEAGSCCGSQPM